MSTLTPEKKIEMLTLLVNNKEMFEALQEALFEGVYEQGVVTTGAKHNPLKNWALSLVYNTDDGRKSDAELGSDLRAMAEGLRFVSVGLDKLFDTYQQKEITPKEGVKKNPAS